MNTKPSTAKATAVDKTQPSITLLSPKRQPTR